MAIRITCRDCGFTGIYKHRGTVTHFEKHSCRLEKKRQAARRRAIRRRKNRGGEKRDCRHKNVHHEHGTRLAYVLDRCKCVPCMDANREYVRERTRLKAYGKWDHRVPAEPVRQRMIELQLAGCGFMQVSRLTGIPKTTLGTLIYGRHDRRDGKPPKTIGRDHADLIMSLAPEPMAMSDGHTIDATGSRRRLQALVVSGWSLNRIGQEIGVQRCNMNDLFVQETVTVRRARQIAELFERGWEGPPVADRHQQAGVTRAKRYAAERGFLSALAWPDDAIDDPLFDPSFEDEPVLVDELAVEQAMSGERVTLTRDEEIEAVSRLYARGVPKKHISELLHITPYWVLQHLDAAADELGQSA